MSQERSGVPGTLGAADAPLLVADEDVDVGDGGGNSGGRGTGHVEGGSAQDVSENSPGSVPPIDVDERRPRASQTESDAVDDEGSDRPDGIPDGDPFVDDTFTTAQALYLANRDVSISPLGGSHYPGRGVPGRSDLPSRAV